MRKRNVYGEYLSDGEAAAGCSHGMPPDRYEATKQHEEDEESPMKKQTKTLSAAQLERQDRRHRDESSGRYARVNPCDGCGRSAGVDYNSHPLTDNGWNDEAIMLCDRCYGATHAMTALVDFRAYQAKMGGGR